MERPQLPDAFDIMPFRQVKQGLIALLGCDVDQTGTIDWAAAAPNLLNVAVTRAKSYLYLIGDRDPWGARQYFDTALAMLVDVHGQVGTPPPN